MLLSARETAEFLGIKLDTLYAYVSRGLLTSVEIADSRERHYDAEDIERFRAERGARGRRVPEALMPVIASAICLIENHRLYYRGRDALQLSQTASLEEVAAILWDTGASPQVPTQPLRGQSPSPAGEGSNVLACSLPGGRARVEVGPGNVFERCQMRLAELAAVDLAALDLTRPGVVRTGGLILGELAAVLGDGEPSQLPVHRQLAEAWCLGESAGDLVRRCLVLLADHELNASTFVARCIASTGATPYAVVSGALAALSGRRHGGASARVEALCRELAAGADPMTVMAARLARDEELPGMGQPLYPDGDPRAAAILAAACVATPDKARWVGAVTQAATQLSGQRPNVDFALGLATVLLDLPPGSAVGMFLMARTVGWLAHAMEQYESGVLIRPRARYSGQRPIPLSGA